MPKILTLALKKNFILKIFKKLLNKVLEGIVTSSIVSC